MTKKILGLDLGTNSIGWALIEQNFKNKEGRIFGMGSRIIPMDAGEMGKFAEGASISKTAERTDYRGTRRLRERHLLRRERLHRVLNVLGFLPQHYANEIDFEKRLGQFLEETEPKLAWKKNGKKKNGKDKFEFIFQGLFEEMIAEFKQTQAELLNRTNRNGEPTKIPYDWAIYYLRKKAIEKSITKEQLAWLILNFNQKRGYYQLRGEEEESNDNVKEFVIALTINKIEKGEVDKKNDKKTWYKMTLSNRWEYSATFANEPQWLNTEKEFLVTEEYDDNGKIKIVKNKKSDTTGKEKRRITLLPTFDEIDLMPKKVQDKIYKKIKARTELTITNSKTTVGAYIYDSLLKNPTQKIRGKLVRTIERKFYKDELRQILKKQIELQPELFTDDLYNDCVRELYRSNEAHQQSLSKRDFVHLFLDDIIFYQRPLRSQKSSIGNCSLEYRLHKINKKDENENSIKNVFEKDDKGKDIEVKEYLKAIPKSNPYYQEFRVWQWLYNLKIYTKDEDKDVTTQFIKGIEDLENLFAFLMSQKEVNHKDIFTYLITPVMKEKYPNAKPKALKDEISKEIAKYRWNYVFDDSKDKEDEKSKKYPMNETGYEIRKRLEKVENVPENFLTREVEQQLWHIIYSITDKKEFEAALETFARKHSLYFVPKAERDNKNPDKKCFVESFKNFKPFKSDYGRYSEKAIKKLLPLMRIGKYWDWNNIDDKTKKRVDKILTGEYDEEIKNQVREKAIHLTKTEDFQGLQLWLAQYIAYGRHSEAAFAGKWQSVKDLKAFLKEFKQHSLRNPIVEQVVTEALHVVEDIWQYYGKGIGNFFDEIHIELGREMKNPADVREKMTRQISDNENTNLRIKAMLMEFSNDDSFKNQRDYKDTEGETPMYFKKSNNPVRPFSPTQQDILKIYEEYVLNDYSEQDLKNEKTGLSETKDGKTKEVTIYDISQKSQPTKSQIEKYKLWLEQKYQSPYTGQMIPLTKLFTPAYEIEHVIPQSRYFDNSLSNKVICESEVNKLKDNQLGLEFIKNHHGEKVAIENGTKTVEIFTEETYKTFVKEHYDKNRGKKNKLLLEEIPDKMIERQLNDTRYISKFITQVLSNIVRIDDVKAKKIIADAEILAGKETDKKRTDEIREKAKSDANDDGVNSKNIIPCNGKITSTLKQDWGLNNVWNELILPRFERMNELNKGKRDELLNELENKKKEFSENNIISKEEKERQISELKKKIQALIFVAKNKEGHTIPAIPLELSKGFQKKRIDHRHHALDALVVACATRDHIQYLNNENAKSQKFHLQRGLAKKLRKFDKIQKTVFEKDENNVWHIKKDENGNQITKEIEVPKAYFMPWENFTADAKNELEKIVVSFKQNLRVINKATNHYQKIINGKKIKVEQKGVNWAIRKPMHEETVSGIVSLPGVKLGKGEITTATRERNDLVSIFKDIKTKDKAESKISKITDTGIQKILINYLKSKDNNPELAFSPEGIEDLNKNIIHYNEGKFHQPIFKVRTYEKGKGRFVLGSTGNKKSKYVQGAPNLFFAIYQDENKNRSFETIPLNIVIERQKQGLGSVPYKNEKGYSLCPDCEFLSPNDLVYVPTEEEQENLSRIDFGNLTNEQKKRLYNVNDFSSTCYFTPNRIAKAIAPKEIDMNYDEKKKKVTGSFDTKTASLDGKQIKDICIKLKMDRLGNISKTNY